MNLVNTYPTSYPEVNDILLQLLSEAQAVLGSHFVGLYLYGSLSSGDFDPKTSDIDFVIVTDEEPSAEIVPELEALHNRLAASGLKWAKKLEGSYISLAGFRRYNPDDPPRPTLNEGKFYLDRHGSDWVIQRQVIREHGLAVAGPPPHSLIDPIQPDEIRQAIVGIFRSWWAPMIDDPSFLRSAEYHAFTVLTMCRTLHGLHSGTIVSKPAAARWAQATLGSQWTALIGQALAWKPGIEWPNATETVNFIRFTWQECQQQVIHS